MSQHHHGSGSSRIVLGISLIAALSGCDQGPAAPSKPASSSTPAAAVSPVKVTPATPTTAATTAPTSRSASASASTTRASNPEFSVDINAPAQTATRPATTAAAKASAPRWNGAHFSVALPDGWKAFDGVAPRIGTLTTPGGLQVAVLIFEGDGGGTLGNVNLWRRHVGLTPAGERELRETSKRIEGAEGPFTLIDLPGPTQRMLAAVLPQSDKTVFLKMTGPFAITEREKDAFIEAAKSLKIGSDSGEKNKE